MSSDDIIDIAKGGLGLPVISVVSSTITYMLMQLMTAFGNLSMLPSSKFLMPSYSTYFALVVILISLMTIFGYFKDFNNGVEYPRRAIIFGLGALVGLKIFWNAIAGINQGGIGQDAIISTIITIILLFGGAAVSYYFRR